MWMWTMNNNEFWIWGGTFESDLKNVWRAYLRILEKTKCITRQINLIVCKGAHFIQIHCFKGAHSTLKWYPIRGAHLRILQGAHFKPKKPKIATFTWFATKARMLPVKCASSDSYVPPPMGAVGDTFEDRGKRRGISLCRRSGLNPWSHVTGIFLHKSSPVSLICKGMIVF